MSNPFAKQTPSVFIVCSPFQALCAIAALRQLNISIYSFYVLMPKGDIRNTQTLALLKHYNIKYRKLHEKSRLYLWFRLTKSIWHRNNRFKRLFIGDIRDIFLIYAGLNFISDGSEVVTLDDGNVTLEYLKDSISHPLSAKHQYIINWISKRRNIIIGKDFLTIYGDIKNPRYNIETLNFHLAVNRTQSSEKQLKGIYIVGTNVDSFCKVLNIPEDIYIKKLGDLMRELCQHYPNDTIYFIPHGREYKNYGERLCEQLGCVFLRPKMMIELELLYMPNPPKAVYGYTSTALYTIKKLFPVSKVVNVLFQLSEKNLYYKSYVQTSDFYLKNGIELDCQPLSESYP